MSENVMLYANQVAVGTSLAQRKPQPDSSFSYSTAEVDAPKPQDPYQPLPLQHTTSCSKSKQPFLKRGTGLQTRIEATRRKRYVPKGGFVKGQTDGDEQSTARPPLLQPLSQASHHHQPLYQAQAPSPQWAEDYDWPPATATSDAQPQQWMPLQQQIAKSAVTTALAEHDLEAEMDADSALVHLPSRPGTQASSQPPSNQKQMLQGNFIAPHASQHLQLPMHSEGIGTEDTRPSVSTSSTQLQPSRADVNSAATEWQLQQATEALELEEFRALERQIVKDAGVPVRGSVQSLPQPARRDALSRSRVMDSPTNQLEQGSGTQCVSQTAQPSRQHEQAQCLPPWDQQPASLANLQNTSGASHRNPQASLPRAAQTKRTVSGNPFADAEDLTESPTDLYAEPLSANLANTAQHMQASQYDDWPPASYAAEQVQQQSVPAVAHIEDFWDPAAEHAPVEQQAVQTAKGKSKPSYIQQMFKPELTTPAQKPAAQPEPDQEASCIAALEQEMKGLQEERAKVAKLRSHLEQGAARQEQDQAAWAKRKEDEMAAWDTEKEAEMQRLKRHQRVLDKQSRALLKLPNRKERSEVEAVEAVLEQERKTSNAKDARHKLTVERLRQKLVELQDINAELREELRFNEQRRLEEWNAKENSQPRAANSQRRPTGSASGSAASTAKKPAAAKPDQNPASKLTVPSHPVVQAPTQPALQAGVVPAAAEPSPQHSASAYDDEDSEEEREGQFSQQGSPAAAVSEQAPWQMHLPLQANQAQLAYQTSGPLAQQLSAQQSYAALHAFDSYPELRGYQQAATQARAQYQQPGSIHQAGVHPEAKREILGKAAPEQASGRPLHAVDADRYGDSVVRSSAGGFVWQPMHPDDRHSISTAAPDASAMFQPLQASSSGFFHSALPDTGDRHEFRDSSHQNAKHDGRFSVSMQQAQQAQDKSAVQQNPGSSISWQDMQQGSDCWSTAAPLDDEHDTYAVSTNGQQEWALMSNSLPANRQRPEDSLPFMTAGQSAVNIWNQSGDDHAAAHSSFAPDRMHSSRHKPDAQSASKDALWQSAGVQPVRRQLSAHASQDMLQSQAESGSNDVHQAAAAQLLTAQSSMQEVHHPDGKVEQVFADGRRTVIFGNGTSKHQFPDGHTTIRFTNQDIKRFYPNGQVEYYYREVDTWHTTHADGVEVFYFPNGQTEAHHPSGVKEIIFPDNVIRKVFPDGKEQDVTPEQLLPAVKLPMPETTE